MNADTTSTPPVSTTKAAADQAGFGKITGEVLLRVDNLVKYFPVSSTKLIQRDRAFVHAVDDVTLEVRQGETLGLVGETGCGKSTFARCVARLYDVTSGTITFGGTDITKLSPRRMRPYRREIQMIFQDPYGSLNPRRRVGSIIGDPFAIHNTASGADRKRRVQELMEMVGLNPEHFNRFPAEFSGGQRQRIGVARALAFTPKLIVCDEPVSALDVSIQAQILNLLTDLQRDLGLTYIFIAHDLSVVRHVSDRVAVMYLGRVIESGATADVFDRPRHPYTTTLLESVLTLDTRRGLPPAALGPGFPNPPDPPSGCAFHPRCTARFDACDQSCPLLQRLPDGRQVACHLYPTVKP